MDFRAVILDEQIVRSVDASLGYASQQLTMLSEWRKLHGKGVEKHDQAIEWIDWLRSRISSTETLQTTRDNEPFVLATREGDNDGR